MGYRVINVGRSGMFKILEEDDNYVCYAEHTTKAEERELKNIPDDRYLEPCVLSFMTEDGTVDLQPFWSIFRLTSRKSLQEGINAALKTMEPYIGMCVMDGITEAIESGLILDNIILLGSGSLHVGGASYCCEHDSQSSFDQVAEAIAISKCLALNGVALPIVAQDPAYSKRDKQCLRNQSITVVQDPDAFDLITRNSIVIAYGLGSSVFSTISKGELPAAILCSDIRDFGSRLHDDSSSSIDIEELNAERENIGEMVDEYERVGCYDEQVQEFISEEASKRAEDRIPGDEEHLQHLLVQAPSVFYRITLR